MSNTVSIAHSGNFNLFACPICQSPLVVDAATWCCDASLNSRNKSHTYDVAKQGYVNLLPVQHKKTLIPGDSKDSILARQRFLQSGFYHTLQSKLVTLVNQAGGDTWMDIGCGEGYYTLAIAEHCQTQHIIAIDISKFAVMTLSKQSKQANYLWSQDQSKDDTPTCTNTRIYPVVATAANPPVQDASLDGIVSIFSPILPKPFANKLKSSGHLIIAKPDIGHLSSVRTALFDCVEQHDSDKFLIELDEDFELVDKFHVEHNLCLDAAQLADLLTMTPYAYRASPLKRQALQKGVDDSGFTTQAKFVIYVVRKRL